MVVAEAINSNRNNNMWLVGETDKLKILTAVISGG